jgi:hypothetical protein
MNLAKASGYHQSILVKVKQAGASAWEITLSVM